MSKADVKRTGTKKKEFAGQDKNKRFVPKDEKRTGERNKNFSGHAKGKRYVKSEEERTLGEKKAAGCPLADKCGGCQYQGMTYDRTCSLKQKRVDELLKKMVKPERIVKMEVPYHYRNKVHAVVDRDNKGKPITGVYKLGTHMVVPVDECMIEDEKADAIIVSIRKMLKSFKIRTYDEDTQYGLLRHILIKRGFSTGEIMVVLVTASPIFPSKKNFVKALREIHPEITTIVQNVNPRGTSMVLGPKEHVLYGKGYIEDVLCGKRFRISSKSFYQINPVQTEKLYGLAMEFAGLTGKETVLDAYCGIGTIGMVAADKAKKVIGVELNYDAVKDARENAKRNDVKNIAFYQGDAGEFMVNMAAAGEKADVVFMDPPRSGSTEQFIDAVAAIAPKKVVYVSCHPETLARDLEYFVKKGYAVKRDVPVDMFPWTDEIENVCLLEKK